MAVNNFSKFPVLSSFFSFQYGMFANQLTERHEAQKQCGATESDQLRCCTSQAAVPLADVKCKSERGSQHVPSPDVSSLVQLDALQKPGAFRLLSAPPRRNTLSVGHSCAEAPCALPRRLEDTPTKMDTCWHSAVVEQRQHVSECESRKVVGCAAPNEATSARKRVEDVSNNSPWLCAATTGQTLPTERSMLNVLYHRRAATVSSHAGAQRLKASKPYVYSSTNRFPSDSLFLEQLHTRPVVDQYSTFFPSLNPTDLCVSRTGNSDRAPGHPQQQCYAPHSSGLHREPCAAPRQPGADGRTQLLEAYVMFLQTSLWNERNRRQAAEREAVQRPQVLYA